jgi:hypothetical protein
MEVIVRFVGKSETVALDEGATVAELLSNVSLDKNTRYEARINGAAVPLTYQLSKGETVFVFAGIIGQAPLLDATPLKDFTRGAIKLTIIDPYICKPLTTEAEYVTFLADAVNLSGGVLKKLHLILSKRPDRFNPGVLSALTAICKRHNCTVTDKETDEIHDRIWIKDDTGARAVGSSLNAVGLAVSAPARFRLAFISELPEDDLKFLIKFLESRNLF